MRTSNSGKNNLYRKYGTRRSRTFKTSTTNKT